MSAMQTEVFEAFRAIDVPEDKALRAAAALTSALSKVDDEASKAISKRDGDIEAIRHDGASIKADVSVLKGDVAVLKGDVTVLNSDVAILKGDVAILKTDVGSLKLEIAAVKGDVTLLKWMVGLAITLDLTILAKLFSH